MVGDIAAINNAIEALKSKGPVLKIVEGLLDYLSCEIKFSNNKKHTWLGQPPLIKNLENKFEGLVNDIQSHETHSTPKFLSIRSTEEIQKIMIEDQPEYQSGIGMLLYLVKHWSMILLMQPRNYQRKKIGTNPAADKSSYV